MSGLKWNQSPARRFRSDCHRILRLRSFVMIRNPACSDNHLGENWYVSKTVSGHVESARSLESVSSTVVPQWLPPKQHGAPPPPVATVVTIHRLYRRDISVVTFTVALTFNNVDNLMFMILQYKKEAAPFRNHVRLGLVLTKSYPFLRWGTFILQ